MAKNIDQVFTANPASSMLATDLYYLGRSPYGLTDDFAITWANVMSSITAVGTLTVGIWNASVIGGTYGGTGVNNGASTITIGGSASLLGAFTFAGTLTGNTAVTFPTSGTLATTSGSLPSIQGTANEVLVNGTSGSPVTGSAITLTTPQAIGTASAVQFGSLSLTTPLALTSGGTNASLTASNGGIFYSTASAAAILSGTATANQVLLSGSSTTPAWSTATYPATTTINQLLYSSSANTVAGITAANSAALVSNSSGVPSFTASMTNGQVVIGSTGGTPTPATLTGSTGITITNGSNTISVASNGAVPWVDETGSSVTMTANTGYTSDDGATLVTFALPTTSAIGDFVEINGKGSGLWKIAQASGQQIFISPTNTTSGAGGSLSSVHQYDCVKLRCIIANTIWVVVSQQSTGLTVV